MDIRGICDSIKKLHTNTRTVLIGIDGLGGAGKSTISESLYTALSSDGFSTLILHIDDFIHPKAIRYNANYEAWECYYNLQWRYDYLLTNIIHPIKQGESLDKNIELYDKENDAYYSYHINVPSGSIVIIEGIFLQRTELSNIFDYTIYLDVPEETRLNRVLKRDGYIGSEEDIRLKYENRYFPAEHFYLDECTPAQKADMVIRVTL